MVDDNPGLARTLRVFISSPTDELRAFRTEAKKVIQELGMMYVSYDDPDGIAPTQSSGSLVDVGRDTMASCDVFLGLFGDGPVWAPATDPYVGDELVKQHPELAEDATKFFVEYEYEWALANDLYVFLFLRTQNTTSVPTVEADPRMLRFTARLRARPVTWLSTPEAFRERLIQGLQAIRPRVFLSYSRHDTETARKLQRHLREKDIHSWRDETSIGGGEKWEAVIETALDSMDVMVVLITAESLKSEWVQREYKAFDAAGKPIIPVLCESGLTSRLPNDLKSIQAIDGFGEKGFDKLAKRVREILAS